jgi:hypothetical protein
MAAVLNFDSYYITILDNHLKSRFIWEAASLIIY